MPAVLVDTGLWVAFVDPRDRNHEKATGWMQTFDGRLLTTTDIFDETVTLVKKRRGHAGAVQVGEMLQRADELDLVEVTAEVREAAWALFVARQDKGCSLTDCTSFVVMRRLGLTEVATFDDDFAQEGFRVVP